ncbi:unnamed protein product [Lactuca saligna]|uniref:MBD domain-containing protein n=1 Tax=Lactuca saligna TaxID=75948 RepID=A0AA35ZF87_LACSI|nr:unnamed protein product [Lactuca saligna]
MKVLCFAWWARLGRIPTLLALSRRNVKVDSQWCSAYISRLETSDHLLLDCPFADHVWRSLEMWCDIGKINANSVRGIIDEGVRLKMSSNRKKKALFSILYGALWAIWRAMNDRIFNDGIVDPIKVVDSIKSMIFLWVKHRYGSNTNHRQQSETPQNSCEMSSIERPEGLPSSWTIEVKGSEEEKRECYIDPETGREFHSMLEVSDYLNTINSSKATETTGDKDKPSSETVIPEKSEAADVAAEDISEKNQETSEKSNEKNAVSASGTQVDGLPPGWIKEVVIRTAKGRTTRKDPYYLDPSSDYAFMSKLDALRYLETGDIEKCAMKPRKKSDIMMKLANTPTKTQSANKKSTKRSNETKKSTSTPPSLASKRLKTSETVEPQSEEQPEKEKNEGGDGVEDDTEQVKGKESNVEKSTNDEKTEIPLTVNGDVPIEVPEIPMTAEEQSVGIEERKNEGANEVCFVE